MEKTTCGCRPKHRYSDIICRIKNSNVFKPVSRGNYFFSEAAVCRTHQGEIVYGTSNGFVTFNPAKLRKSNFVPTICFTEFQLFNKTVNVGDPDSPLKQAIDETRELILSSKQNTFSIEYAALDHANPQGIQYACKLDGFDREWNYVGNQRTATYINLPKGKYVFRVKSTNADGEWAKNERTIRIEKLPSFWESAWGWLFYIILILVFSAVVAYVLFIIYRLRNEVEVEQRITNMKLHFFTDISHELRTPLTLIASPVESILKKEPISAKVREQLEIVEKNTARMLRLINQILDFRKIQSEKMKLIVEEVAIASFLNEICMSFTKLAEENNIRLHVTNDTNNARLWVDKDKFEKIIFNLLSNAFKFTEPGRNINVLLDENESNVIITVRDQGIGIQKDRIKLLFNRFESFANAAGMMQNSTGIGLSLTKELVELHKGRIEVESETGKGSEFRVIFRKGLNHFGSGNEFVLHDGNQSDAVANTTHPEVPTETETVKNRATERSTILIAEDNEELRGFLKATLSRQYDILEAEDGWKALDIALKELPDLIVSDITMPGVDGIEFAQKIKQDMNTSHIPFILLTAKIDLDTKLQAMNLCVDDYITKPFSLTYLEARIENLLKIREQLQAYFKSSLEATGGIITLSKPEITSVDEQFIQKTLTYIDENYGDSEMNIDNIAAFAGVSRSSFFKKIKSLTGFAPVDFVREYRIQKAIQMLESGETNISQIAYSVGINDTKYFSRCFKQRFGVNPSEYKAKKNRNS
ncbi:MAG: hybrid sensor histidine kinase/response regulator transcription factor [Paludibacter sp.]